MLKAPKPDQPKKIPIQIEEYYKFQGYSINKFDYKGAVLCCSKCSHSFGYELYADIIYTPKCGYPADHVKLNEEINRKISAHYLEFHRGFN